MFSRRRLLSRIGWLAAGGLALGGAASTGATPGRDWLPDRAPGPRTRWRLLGERLRASHPELSRHFVFEYYPWYGASPWRHWQQWDRNPPHDIAASSMPRLGPYDSRDLAVIERHAGWIAESGVGAIDLSWWGKGSYEDRLVHRIMDVMHDHDIKVAFHLEPYTDHRSAHLLRDVLYLLHEYGDRRSWDAFLLLRDASGRMGPVFKTFRTILPAAVTDCHGITRRVSDHTSDDAWAAHTEAVRETLREDFDRVLLLADALNMNRVAKSGFDGVAVYDNYVEADSYRTHAARATERGLLFSFNCNPGFDGIVRREATHGSCYRPPDFFPDPGGSLDFSRAADRERARRLAQRQIRRSFRASLLAQTDPLLRNRQEGFFLMYVNSFNEWHEGHAFEPAAPRSALSRAQHMFGYHNPRDGDYRLATLRGLMREILAD